MTATADIPWADIHAIPSFVDAPMCWDTYQCGSYCCKSNHEDFNFRFIRKGMVQLPMCPDEYRYLKCEDKFQDYDKGAISTHSIEFAPGRTATCYMMRCKCGGNCLHPDYRPLICKVYPYFPVPSPEGVIEQFEISSVFDVAMQAQRGEVGCPLRRADPPGLASHARKTMQAIFVHPHLIFYFRAGAAMVDLMRESLRNDHADILTLHPKQYFRAWETLYLMGDLCPPERVKQRLAAIYDEVAAVWGEFSTE